MTVEKKIVTEAHMTEMQSNRSLHVKPQYVRLILVHTPQRQTNGFLLSSGILYTSFACIRFIVPVVQPLTDWFLLTSDLSALQHRDYCSPALSRISKCSNFISVTFLLLDKKWVSNEVIPDISLGSLYLRPICLFTASLSKHK